MTDRSKRLGLEPGSLDGDRKEWQPATDAEIAHSIAISLRGLRIAADRIAKALENANDLKANRP